MPNHTGQLLTVTGPKESINRMKAFVGTAHSNFDHNAFFSMPLELVDTCSPLSITPDEEYPAALNKYLKELSAYESATKPAFMKPHPPVTRAKANELLEKYGAANWYDWANTNWGTKWGIYDAGEWCDSLKEDTTDSQSSIGFQSAWSPANKIIVKLSSLFPDLKFYLEAADEGGGFVCAYTIKDGEEHCEDLDWNGDLGITVRENVGYGPSETEEEEIEG